MTMSTALGDREYFRYVQDAAGNTTVRVLDVSSWLFEKVGRKIDVSYPSATTEQFDYYDGVSLFMTILVTYTDATKANVDLVERTA